MQLLKPQQTVYLQNAWQVGKEAHLGVAIGLCLHSETANHYLHEASAWRCFKRASVPKMVFYENLPKARAEFMVAPFCAPSGERVQELSASVGGVSRRLGVAGGGDTEQPIEHGDERLNLAGARGRSMAERARHKQEHGARIGLHSLATDHPIRQSMYNASSVLRNQRRYMEEYYPGMPDDLDPRYFQCAASEQWADDAHWTLPLRYQCSREWDALSMSGTVPELAVELLCWEQGAALAQPQQHLMLPDTCWLFPEDRCAVVFFRFDLPLADLRDEPYQRLMFSVTAADKRRSLAQLLTLAEQRSEGPTRAMASMLDDELMPEGAHLELIDNRDEPGAPGEAARKLYADVRAGMAAQADIPLDDKDLAAADVAVHELAEEELSFVSDRVPAVAKARAQVAPAQRYGADTPAPDFETHQHFEATHFDQIALSAPIEGVQFRRCRFEGVQFDADVKSTSFADCQFDRCRVGAQRWSGVVFKRCHGDRLCFEGSQTQQLRFDGGHWRAIESAQCEHRGLAAADGRIDELQFSGGELISAAFESLRCDRLQLQELNLEAVVAIKLRCQSLAIEGARGSSFSVHESAIESLAIRASAIESAVWIDSQIDASRIERSTCPGWLFRGTPLKGAQVSHCELPSLNLERAELERLRVEASDLRESNWYGAQLRSCELVDNLLVDADFALLSRSPDTVMKGNLDTGARFLPAAVV